MPGMTRALAALVLLAASQAGLAAASDFERALAEGLALIEGSDPQAGGALIERAIARERLHAEAPVEPGELFAMLGQWLEALERLREAYEALPESERRAIVADLIERLVATLLAAIPESGAGGEPGPIVREAFTR